MAIHASRIQIIRNIHNELDELLEIYFEFYFETLLWNFEFTWPGEWSLAFSLMDCSMNGKSANQ